MSKYRVRFASKATLPFSHHLQAPVCALSLNTSKSRSSGRGQRSRSGCRECRQRRVKCDETFPVCKRCQRRGSVCQPVPPTSQWLLETPWLGDHCRTSVGPLLDIDGSVNPHLMRYWLERMSRIMTLDPDNNCMSFPILRYFSVSPSLIYVIQCQQKMATSLEQRGKALSSLRAELETQTVPLAYSLLTLLMLGMSSSWITASPSDYGREHLIAARAVADLVLEQAASQDEELTHLTMGFHVYWDMACSFCLDPLDQPTGQRASLAKYVKAMRHKFHNITAHSMDLYFMLGQLGRYCRLLVEGGGRDLVYEALTEQNLLDYESAESERPAKLLTEAFRKHGLLLLYRFSGRTRDSNTLPVDAGPVAQIEAELTIRGLALDILDLLQKTETDSPYLNLHTIPVLNAGAELTSLDTEERKLVRERLTAIYSTNRLVPTLWVIDLLEELWSTNDAGVTKITWLELMIRKNWRLRIG
ncbi:hypothetical protein BJX68DRAFT_252720 [Aspergillus pseudodeflectus]|uniref:Zn(2)-C6 fungal-type domain-containing protein n=1 Tax=Aspergillus pseudodeflectus TaxID=176178 RepID=A0ABR4L376_9EURO